MENFVENRSLRPTRKNIIIKFVSFVSFKYIFRTTASPNFICEILFSLDAVHI